MIQLAALLPKLAPTMTPSSENEAVEPEFMTAQHRVIHLLETHSGTTWQSHIVSETDWSKSKVSRVLSEMEADGSICRHQVKRQKVVCLPGSEPDCLKDRIDVGET